MSPTLPPPAVTPLDDERLAARQVHLEREIARTRARAPRRRIVRGGIVVAAGLAAAAVLLTGRGSGPDAVAKALAAVSRGPYLGIVVHSPRPIGSSTLVHLDTHAVEPVRGEAELWFDTRKHGRAASVGGCTRVVGPTTRSGCVGSAFEYRDNSLITGSIDSYRSALASGKVHRAGAATVRGRKAWWLRFPAPRNPRYATGWIPYVAVDQKTGDPLRVESRNGARTVGRQDIDVLPETHRLPSYLLTLAKLMRPPALAVGKRHQHGGRPATLAEAVRAVPGALWPGRSAAGEPFSHARIITLDDGRQQLELRYGRACPKSCVLVKQGLDSGWAPGSRLYSELPNHSLLVNGGRYGDGRSGAIRIRIEGTGRAAVLATARALRPLRA